MYAVIHHLYRIRPHLLRKHMPIFFYFSLSAACVHRSPNIIFGHSILFLAFHVDVSDSGKLYGGFML